MDDKKTFNLLGPWPETDCAPHTEKNWFAYRVCSERDTITKVKEWLKSHHEDPSDIIEEAMEKTNCDSERCVIHKLHLPTDVVKPSGPLGPTEWLSNKHIEATLKNYQKLFPVFQYCPIQMRDFKESKTELATLNWRDVLSKYSSFGCVFNTDYSYGNGEHWIALYVDLEKRTVEFFDSGGQRPLPEFNNFIISLAALLSELTATKYKSIVVAKIQHQKIDGPCGVYALFYIISRLHGVPFSRFEYERIPDDIMTNFRRYLFQGNSRLDS
jgi:hypothetical protein